MITREQLEHAVDQARLQSYAQFGDVFAIDPVQFADLMIEFGDLGIKTLEDAKQPPIEVEEVEVDEISTFDDPVDPSPVSVTMGVGAAITDPVKGRMVSEIDTSHITGFKLHKFQVDRGGVNCIKCDVSFDDGNHEPE